MSRIEAKKFIEQMIIQLADMKEEYDRASKIYKIYESGMKTVMDLCRKHRIKGREIEDNGRRITLDIKIGHMTRVDNSKIPLNIIDTYKSKGEVWRKSLIVRDMNYVDSDESE